jgi:Calcineurin-like phosphoesterase
MNQPVHLGHLALGSLAILGLGCVSQTLIMARASSGAVDRDVEFTAQPAADGHFISLPAYPLSNCTDTLVYERLVGDFDEMIRALGSMPIDEVSQTLERENTVDNAAPLHFLIRLAGTNVGKLLTKQGLHDEARRRIAEALVDVIDPVDRKSLNMTAGRGEAKAERSTKTAEEKKEASSQALQAQLSAPTSWRRSRSRDEWNETRNGSAVMTYVNQLVAANTSDLNLLLTAGGKDKFAEDAMTKLIVPSNSKDKDVVASFAHAAADFVSYADDYGPSACASALRYHDFLGFRKDVQLEGSEVAAKKAKVSWLDRSPCAQLDVLAAIANLAGFSPKTCKNSNVESLWPKPIQSFLHFSDVQIREPSAKLGSTQLSHDLKQLVPSFEQDYVQNEYAMFVYDALVKTVNAERELDTDRDRPRPAIMIHTGDSADTGLQSEFETFATITGKLHVPWFQTVGNHDVVAFGNLRLAGKNTPHLLEDVRCQGAKWNRIACSCTSIGTLIREKETREPNNRGEIADSLPNGVMPIFPLLLQRVCLLHAVQADWFVMDPDKYGSDDPTKSFIQSQCKGWRPVPRDPSVSDHHANERALDECLGGVSPAKGTPAPAALAAPGPAAQSLPTQPGSSGVAAATPDFSCASLDKQGSQFNGFDLIPGFRHRLGQVPAKDSANPKIGYYCFEVGTITEKEVGTITESKERDTVPDRRLWAIILNTNTNEGSYGYLADEQLDWLSILLHENTNLPDKNVKSPETVPPSPIGPRDLVMLFSHHPVWSIYDQRLRMRLTDIVTRSPNVIGYFAGHTHQAGLRVIRPLSGSPGTAKWEIVAPSVIDYPQAVRQVTIKSANGLGYIEVLTFTSNGTGPTVEKIKAAEQGAVRDRCVSFPDQCVDGHALLPGREIEFPRLFFKMP